MTTDFFEYYFLASCYEQGVSEDTVYKLFIEKIIADYVYPKFPYIISISSFQKYIVDKYKIEIPPTFIKSLVKTIDGYNTNILLKKDNIAIISNPIVLQQKYATQQKKLDENTRKIFEQFNKYLENNNQNKITYKKFYETISIFFSRVTNINSIEETELSKLLILWIKDIYRITSNKKIQNVFDKLIYSWLLYSYFYSVKRSKKNYQETRLSLIQI